MKILLTALLLSMTVGCYSTSNYPTETVSKLRKGMETAIARKILAEISHELPKLKGSLRHGYLDKKSKQFRRSVEPAALNSSTLQEFKLLVYITELERIRWYATDYETRVRTMSSSEIDLRYLESLLTSSLESINKKLIALIKAPNQDLSFHITEVRETASYPDDSFAGKQAYLDALELEILTSFKSLQHLPVGGSRKIELRGKETSGPTFFYAKNQLTINLSAVEALPDFELASVAAFYGYPGQAALSDLGPTKSLKSLLQLTGFNVGWAWYNLEKIANQDIEHVKRHLYFLKLITLSALADLRLHTNTWSKRQAAENIYRQTPYTMNRINSVLADIQNQPGYYLSAFAGKVKLIEIERRCISDCESTLLHRLIALGPLPFNLLEERLITEKIIQ